jgi:hypothetical protein
MHLTPMYSSHAPHTHLARTSPAPHTHLTPIYSIPAPHTHLTRTSHHFFITPTAHAPHTNIFCTCTSHTHLTPFYSSHAPHTHLTPICSARAPHTRTSHQSIHLTHLTHTSHQYVLHMHLTRTSHQSTYLHDSGRVPAQTQRPPLPAPLTLGRGNMPSSALPAKCCQMERSCLVPYYPRCGPL